MKRWLKRSSKTDFDEVREMLSSYIDNELKSDERRKVESHLKSCRSCQVELDSLRKTSDILQQLPEIKLRRSFVISKSEAAGKTQNGKLWLLSGITAAVALILILIFVGDVGHYFDASPLTPLPETLPPGINEYSWPVRQTEFGLLGAFTALAAFVSIYWFSLHRKRHT